MVLGVAESNQGNWKALLAALGSALFYAVHLLLFRRELRKGDGINAPLLVGEIFFNFNKLNCLARWTSTEFKIVIVKIV